MFKARVLKDKSVEQSAEGVGHAMGDNKKTKDFEKLETIAVGRALAMLGYMANGEVASTEEMEEFYNYRQEKVQEAAQSLLDCSTVEELKATFIALGSMMAEKQVVEAKDKRKAELLNASA